MSSSITFLPSIPSPLSLKCHRLPSQNRVVSLRTASCASKITATAEAAPKKPLRGITRPKPISPDLQAVVGEKEIPRTQALKKIWAYIKDNNLQDPDNKKIIVCDEKLKKVFAGKDRVGFLEIAGLLNPHFGK